MKLLKVGTLFAACLAMAANASAAVYTDTNTHNVDITEGNWVDGTWNYGPIGAGEVLTLVETWFTFESGDSQEEKYQVVIGTDGADDFTTTSGMFNFGSSGITVNWSFTGATNAALLADAANGELSYRVSAPSDNQWWENNDFTFKTAKVNVTTRAAGVPDNTSTVALLGLGLLGLVCVKRRTS